MMIAIATLKSLNNPGLPDEVNIQSMSHALRWESFSVKDAAEVLACTASGAGTGVPNTTAVIFFIRKTVAPVAAAPHPIRRKAVR